MPFIRVSRKVPSADAIASRVVMSASKTASKRGQWISHISLRISKAVLEDMAIVFGENTWVELFEGVRDDRDMLQIAACSPDASIEIYKMTMSKKGFQGALSITASRFRHYALNEQSAPSTPVKFKVDNSGTLTIWVPDWLRYHELNLPKMLPQPEPVAKRRHR